MRASNLLLYCIVQEVLLATFQLNSIKFQGNSISLIQRLSLSRTSIMMEVDQVSTIINKRIEIVDLQLTNQIPDNHV